MSRTPISSIFALFTLQLLKASFRPLPYSNVKEDVPITLQLELYQYKSTRRLSLSPTPINRSVCLVQYHQVSLPRVQPSTTSLFKPGTSPVLISTTPHYLSRLEKKERIIINTFIVQAMANRRPVGHAFEPPTSEPVATPQRRLLTAYRASAPIWTHQDSPLPSSPQETQLNAFFMGKLDEAAGGDPDYRAALATLLRSFPQGDQAPQRPDPSQMQSLFAKVYFPTQTRTRGKGSKGGIKHHECQWSRCDYKGTLQKCIDHFFSEHIKLKFFQCDQDSW